MLDVFGTVVNRLVECVLCLGSTKNRAIVNLTDFAATLTKKIIQKFNKQNINVDTEIAKLRNAIYWKKEVIVHIKFNLTHSKQIR